MLRQCKGTPEGNKCKVSGAVSDGSAVLLSKVRYLFEKHAAEDSSYCGCCADTGKQKNPTPEQPDADMTELISRPSIPVIPLCVGCT